MKQINPSPGWADSHRSFPLPILTSIFLVVLGNTPAVIAADNVPTVGVIKPMRKTVSSKLAIPANVVPYEQAEIYAKASGYVKKVLVDIGDRVNPGQILAELDLPEMAMEMKVVEAELRKAQAMFLEASQADKLKAQANLEKLQTALNLQNIHFRRVEQLFKDKAYTEAQFEEAEGNLETAKANLLLAKAELEATKQGEAVAKANVELNQAKVDRMKTLIDYETLHAPFAGIVSERNIDTGDFVRSAEGSTGPSLFTIVQVDKVRVRMEIPESDVGFVVAGKTVVQLEFRSRDLAPEATTIARIASTLMPRTRTMVAEVDLNNSEGRILSGMYVLARLQLNKLAQALVIPSGTVRRDGDQYYVWVVRGNILSRKPIVIGYDDGSIAAVLEGLDESTQVLKSASGALKEGMKVTARPVGF